MHHHSRSIFGFGHSTTSWGEAEWKSVLHLATRWQMVDIRSIAIAKLSKCASAISKIYLGQQYDHSPWIIDGVLVLCLREHPLTEHEVSGMSILEILGIAAAREKVRLHIMMSSCQPSRRFAKCGTCLGYQTYQDSGSLEPYSQCVFHSIPRYVVVTIHGFLFPDKMVYDILGNTFGIDHLTTDLVSQPPSPQAFSPRVA